MARFFFIRHGESEANRLRVISNRGCQHGLTARGRAQAQALARALAPLRLAGLYTSPLLRAVETAAYLAPLAGGPAEAAPALGEFDCGVIEGRADAEAWARHAALIAAWMERGDTASRIEGGESFDDVRGRFLPFVRALAARHPARTENVALVSHGGLLHLMLPLLLANVDDAYSRAHPIGNTAIVVAEARGEAWACVAWAGAALVGSATGNT